MRLPWIAVAMAACCLALPAAAQEPPPSTSPPVPVPERLLTPLPAPTAAPPSAGIPAPAPPDAAASAPGVSAPPASPAPPADTAAAKPAPPSPPPVTLAIDIDLTRQRMTVTEHGTVVGSWPISSGRAGYRTPRGTFRPLWQARMWYSRQYDDAPMPHSVFFNGGIAMHATTETRLLGRPASHGCIRQSPANAARTYALVSKHGYKHTRIVVRGTPRDTGPALAARRGTPDPRITARDDVRSAERSGAMRRVIMIDPDGSRRVTYMRRDDPRIAGVSRYRPWRSAPRRYADGWDDGW